MRKQISKYSLKKSTEHLYYEVSTFYSILIRLTNPKDQAEINILLDAFAIHTRNIFDFFYPKKQIKKDDMLVTDFLINKKFFNNNKTKKRDLFFIVRKTDKQVAHLTYSRNRYSKKNKSWSFVLIGQKIHKTLSAFYDSLPSDLKKWKNIIELKKIIDSIRF